MNSMTTMFIVLSEYPNLESRNWIWNNILCYKNTQRKIYVHKVIIENIFPLFHLMI